MKRILFKTYKKGSPYYLILITIFIFLFSPLINSKSNPGKFSCFKVDVPKYWVPINSGPGEWFFQSYLPGGGGARTWFMILVHKNAPLKPEKPKWMKITGTDPKGAERLTGGKAIKTKGGTPWYCYEGTYPSGKKHITYNITIPGEKGYSLSASCVIMGAENFNRSGTSAKFGKFLRKILSSLRITKSLKKCNPDRTGPIIKIPPVLAKIAFAGKPKQKPVSTGVKMDPIVKNNTSSVPPRIEPEKVKTAPSLKIHELKIEPSIVKGGDKFTFIVNITLKDPNQKRAGIEVEMQPEILKGTSTLYTGKAENINVPNGKPYLLKKTLNSTRKAGQYKVKVTISYKDLKKTIARSFKIQ